MDDRRRSPKKPIDDRRSPKKPIDDRRSPKKPIDDRRSPNKPIDDRRSPKKPIDDRRSPKKPIDDRRSPKKPIDDRRSPKKPIDDRRSPKKPVTDNSPSPKKLLTDISSSPKKVTTDTSCSPKKPSIRSMSTARSKWCRKGILRRRSHEMIEEQDYYHGLLPREDAEQMLKKDGDFLVRYSEVDGAAKKYVISCFWNKVCSHFVIEHSKDGFKLHSNEYFQTIPDLICKYWGTDKSINNQTGAKLIKRIGQAAWELHHEQITAIEKVGEGAFGVVYRGILNMEDGKNQEVAVKQSRMGTLTKLEIKEIMRETRLMRQYDHENVVKFYGVAAAQEPIMIVMELVLGGALNKYVHKHAEILTNKHLAKFCLDAANGLNYLHSKKCIHRDVAARNCLITNNKVAKISDFGLSRTGSECVDKKKQKLPIKWLSPETISYNLYTTKSDVWSFGVLMWEVFSEGADPYPGMTGSETIRAVVKEGYRMKPPERMPDAFKHLLDICWERDPDRRPSFNQICHTISRSPIIRY